MLETVLITLVMIHLIVTIGLIIFLDIKCHQSDEDNDYFEHRDSAIVIVSICWPITMIVFITMFLTGELKLDTLKSSHRKQRGRTAPNDKE